MELSGGKLLTRAEFAQSESLSLRTIDRLITNKVISAVKYGRLTRIPETERDRFRASLTPRVAA
jgi:excisionase family DNA binding protein